VGIDTAKQAGDIIEKHGKRTFDLAADSVLDILDNHPSIKNTVGKDLDQLKALGDQYGPEAKKQVDQTWEQIQDVIRNGIRIDSANKIRNIVQKKLQEMREMGDEAWKKGMEEMKPYLDKSPQGKEMIEKNADYLKQGNVTELYSKLMEAVDSGSTDNLERYIQKTVDQAKKSSAGGSGGARAVFKRGSSNR
jgi:glutamyl-tRNA reductase